MLPRVRIPLTVCSSPAPPAPFRVRLCCCWLQAEKLAESKGGKAKDRYMV